MTKDELISRLVGATILSVEADDEDFRITVSAPGSVFSHLPSAGAVGISSTHSGFIEVSWIKIVYDTDKVSL